MPHPSPRTATTAPTRPTSPAALLSVVALLAFGPAVLGAQPPAAGAARGAGPDPLAALRRRSPHVVVPAGARYDSTCSRALGGDRAVFSVGPDGNLGMPAVREAAARPARSEGERTINVLAAMQRSPAWQAFSAAVHFYEAQGFRHAKTVTTSARMGRPEREGDPIVVMLHVANPHVERPGCEHIHTAVIELAAPGGGAPGEGQ
ncbi:MAG TPA: hypothetical protein VFS08_03470 [Gemmatimonadaceae bacterium]|nr:hypothetical protein [Gemmatimonadaceae bacterium]